MRKLVTVAFAASLMLALLACGAHGSADGPGGSVLGDVKVGKTLHLEGDYKTIDVHVLQIVEDTRCAASAQCAEQSHVSVRLQVDTVRSEDSGGATSDETTIVIPGGNTPTAQTVDGVWINVYYVEPALVTGQPIERGDYSVRMRITDVVFG